MNLSIAASLLLLRPSAVSAIFPAPLELRKQGECIDGWRDDLRGDATHPPSLKVEELVLTEEQCQQLVNTTAEEEFGSTLDRLRFFNTIAKPSYSLTRFRPLPPLFHAQKLLFIALLLLGALVDFSALPDLPDLELTGVTGGHAAFACEPNEGEARQQE